MPELNTNNVQLENAPSLLGKNESKDNPAQTEYAPRVLSGKLTFLIRSALNSGIYGEPRRQLGWYQLASKIDWSSGYRRKTGTAITQKWLGMSVLVQI